MDRLLIALSLVGLVTIGCDRTPTHLASKDPGNTAPAQRDAGSTSTGRSPSGQVRQIPRPTSSELSIYRQRLGDHAYHILFEAGTERPFSNAYHDNKKPGTYVSAVTGKPLFRSADKFDSGTGWPSFVQPIDDDAVILRDDDDGSGRVEVLDASSGGHLGHVFDDGPTDRGGKRYCMNSAAMKFVPDP